MITLDFETEAIAPYPDYPPKPVGVALKSDGKPAKYFAWGHPTGNNSTYEKAKVLLEKIWAGKEEVLCHNSKFDLDVACKHFGLPMLPWHRVHDTLYLLFLDNPHAHSLSLKPAAEAYLGMPPEEQDAVKNWLVEHGVITRNQNAGAFICKCDGRVVGEYAIGDVDRTFLLYRKLFEKICGLGMGPAYDRERKLMPILLANEKEGIRVDLERLHTDVAVYSGAMVKAEEWLRTKLNAPSLNLDADAEVAKALKASGQVKEFAKTKTGRDSTSKKNLTIDRFRDKAVFGIFGYRNRLKTVLSQSMLPWAAQARASGGYITTEWNQVRQSHGNDFSGTRSGRLSCSRLMNISKSFEGFQHPTRIKLPPLPLVRKYLVPDEGCLFAHADYNQQEFRILAHYEDGALMEAYRENPRIDYHDKMQELISTLIGQHLERRPVKILNFGINYGMGLGKLAQALEVDTGMAKILRDAQRRAAPGVQALDQELKRRGRAGEAIRTWGGRRYFCEEPKEIKEGPRRGEMQTFEYKLLNYLIQGSAADCTKEALVRYSESGHDARFLVTVHDEINISAPAESARKELRLLQDVMEGIEFDVPMLTDGKIGPSWGELKKESK